MTKALDAGAEREDALKRAVLAMRQLRPKIRDGILDDASAMGGRWVFGPFYGS